MLASAKWWSRLAEKRLRAVCVLSGSLLAAPSMLAAQLPASGGGAIDAAVLVGAGDIANCDSDGDELTASLLDSILAENEDAVVFTLGDNVYERGTEENFAKCYDPTWGRHKAVTRPVPGNHDYKNGFLWFVVGGHAGPYFDYFNSLAKQAGNSATGTCTP
ncbi:MAG: metallophosphoesterase family protein [Gemmatimonadales bacterium]